ncbi:MAG: transcriptional repressor [Gemmatimonadetes bacterium]|nr:transcriptional repressor [Gemmatimonadota bacterium]NNM05325.1 transcriptional repressor [Gemmatimonadota bacterium]
MNDMIEMSPSLRLFRRYLKEQGLPVTHQREAVAQVVFTSAEHLSVEDIESRLRSEGDRIGKATIYRTLDLLVRSRLVVVHDFGEGFKRYEQRLSRGSAFEHLICLECGRVIEFDSWEVQEVKAEVTQEHGFRPIRHKLEIYGLCRPCQEAGVELPDDGLTCPIETV